MFYKEADFMSNGYHCIVVFGSHGHRCGYVGVPEAHPLYRMNYYEECPLLSFDDIKEQPTGKRGAIPIFISSLAPYEGEGTRPDLYFDVHGSVTYSGFHPACTEQDDNLWYFGFDCGHAGDKNDHETAFRYGLIDDERYKYYIDFDKRYDTGGVVRSLGYCIEECKGLAAQLSKIENKKSRNKLTALIHDMKRTIFHYLNRLIAADIFKPR